MAFRNNGTPPPPRAFMSNKEHQALWAISKMAEEQRWLISTEIKVPELCQLYVNPEHRDPLTTAFGLMKYTSVDQQMTIALPYPDEYDVIAMPANNTSAGSVVIEWDHTKAPDGFFSPPYQITGPQNDAPTELIEKYNGIWQRLARVTYEWGMVKHVFNTLNSNGFCNTPQQMRFVWPAIRHIVDRFDKSLGDTLVDASSRAGDKARIPSEITELMVPTVNIVARSLLLDRVKMDERRDHVLKIGLVTFAFADTKFDGIV